MNPFAISGLLITITCFSLAGLLLFRSPPSLQNRLLMWFNVCVGVWGLGDMLAGIAVTPGQAIWGWRLAHVGGYFLGVVFYHLALVLCHEPKRSHVRVTYLFALVCSLGSITGLLLNQTRFMFGSLYYVKASVEYVLSQIIWVAIAVAGHRRLFIGYRQERGVERTQMRFVFYAMATGFIGGTSVWLPMYGLRLYPYGNFSVPLYSLIITYAIVKYRFTDSRIVITRTGLLLGTYLVVLGFPFVAGWWGRPWFETMLGNQWWLVPLGLCTALATAGPFAYAYLRRQAEARLLREQWRYQRTLQRAARGMTQVRDVTKLSELITRIVSRSVRVSHASLFLWDKISERYVLRASHGSKRLALQSRYGLERLHPFVRWLQEHRRVLSEEEMAAQPDAIISQEMRRLDAELAIPGLIEHRLVGFLVLGAKLSGVGYSTDDLHAFAMLANEAAMALENASSYEELIKVNEQLKSASERLLFQERLAAAGQFAMGMAHEIKNPLSAIKTFAQYLPEKYADPAFREKFFRVVQVEIDRINTIVKELSDFAKPAPLQLQPVHVSSLIEDTLALLSNQCLKQGVEIHNSFSENGLAIKADPQQLKQVLLNLFLNSLEAMPRGGRLEVATHATATHLILRVRDTGHGINPERQREVWDPFFTTKERGMGLGLAIVKGVIERHGGQISLSSIPNHGTTFELLLPL